MSVVVGISGLTLSQQDIQCLRHPLVSGVILFTRNYQDSRQLVELTRTIRALRGDLFIGVDQEGGRVQRFQEGFSRLPSFADISAYWAADPARAKSLAYAAGYVMAYELVEHGVDFSFTPVLDLDRGLNTVIGDRSFGADPSVVTALASELCRAIATFGMPTIGKHFPGHGGVSADTHIATAIDTRNIELIQADLYPFAELIKQGLLNGIMPAHVIYSNVDTQPAGFSAKWLGNILRQQLQFPGSIFSDCLTMQAAVIEGGLSVAARAALNAGCDYVLICNELAKIPAVLADLETDCIPSHSFQPATCQGDLSVYQHALQQLGEI